MHILKKIGFYTAFILPLLILVGFYLGEGWNFLTVIFVFAILPAIDFVVGLDTTNIEDEKVKQVAEAFYYRFITYVWTFVQVVFLFWGAYAIATVTEFSLVEWIGFILSFGLMTGGVGITVAHELGHKKPAIERFYSKVLLMTTCYMHFYIEHNRGHHVAVATLDDPATSRKNESFYAFWFRSVFVGYAHAWKLETENLKRNNQSVIGIHNQLIWFTLFPLLFCALLLFFVYAFTGQLHWSIPIFFFGQSILAFTLLELVNYIEHYGILRKELSPGRYERVNALHSWNASHLISNFFLFQLQRHSDHHANAYKRYQVLNHYNESPQLPYGYPTMIIIALVPPLWFALMNNRLENWKSQETIATLAN